MKSTGTSRPPAMAIFLLLVFLVQAGCSPVRETAGVLLERELRETLQGAGIQHHRCSCPNRATPTGLQPLCYRPPPGGEHGLPLCACQANC